MLLQLRYRWKGRIRASLRDAAFTLNSLLTWNAKNSTQGLFTPEEATTVLAAHNIMNAKIALKILK